MIRCEKTGLQLYTIGLVYHLRFVIQHASSSNCSVPWSLWRVEGNERENRDMGQDSDYRVELCTSSDDRWMPLRTICTCVWYLLIVLQGSGTSMKRRVEPTMIEWEGPVESAISIDYGLQGTGS